MLSVASQVKANIGIKITVPPPVLNKVGTVMVLIRPALETKEILFGDAATGSVVPVIVN